MDREIIMKALVQIKEAERLVDRLLASGDSVPDRLVKAVREAADEADAAQHELNSN